MPGIRRLALQSRPELTPGHGRLWRANLRLYLEGVQAGILQLKLQSNITSAKRSQVALILPAWFESQFVEAAIAVGLVQPKSWNRLSVGSQHTDLRFAPPCVDVDLHAV